MQYVKAQELIWDRGLFIKCSVNMYLGYVYIKLAYSFISNISNHEINLL